MRGNDGGAGAVRGVQEVGRAAGGEAVSQVPAAALQEVPEEAMPMPVVRRYAATSAELHDEAYSEYDSDWHTYSKDADELQPIPPDDSGQWDLRGAAATKRFIFWFWQREEAPEDQA